MMEGQPISPESAVAGIDTPMNPASSSRARLLSDADVSLLCRGQQQLPAHKTVLRLASPVWKDFTDRNPNATVIPAEDDDPVTMELLLDFLYHVTPRPVVDEHNVEALARLAHKYGITSVLDACSAFVADGLELSMYGDPAGGAKPWEAPGNVLRWLLLGDAWGMPGATSKCIDALVCLQPSGYKCNTRGTLMCLPCSMRRHAVQDEYLIKLGPATVRQMLKKFER